MAGKKAGKGEASSSKQAPPRRNAFLDQALDEQGPRQLAVRASIHLFTSVTLAQRCDEGGLTRGSYAMYRSP
jgi:hypothetical protein